MPIVDKLFFTGPCSSAMRSYRFASIWSASMKAPASLANCNRYGHVSLKRHLYLDERIHIPNGDFFSWLRVFRQHPFCEGFLRVCQIALRASKTRLRALYLVLCTKPRFHQPRSFRSQFVVYHLLIPSWPCAAIALPRWGLAKYLLLSIPSFPHSGFPACRSNARHSCRRPPSRGPERYQRPQQLFRSLRGQAPPC